MTRARSKKEKARELFTLSRLLICKQLFAKAFNIVVYRILDDVDSFLSRTNLIDVGFLALEVFIDGEEVAHFLENMRGKVLYVLVMIVVRVVEGNGDDLLIVSAVIHHRDNSDGVGANKGHGFNILGTYQQHVERVAVITVGAGDESVVCWIVRRGVEDSVEYHKSGFLVKLVFLLRALRDLYNADEVLGCYSLRGYAVPDVCHGRLLLRFTLW